MEIYPAIDILDGKCVRLMEGDYKRKTIYFDQPEEAAQWIASQGAKNLHLVDLNGAKEPSQRQLSLIQNLMTQKESPLKIQCGGGIRTLTEARDLIALGVDRVVLGSIALQNPELVKVIIAELSANRITLALDVRDEALALQGWAHFSDKDLQTTLKYYLDLGIQRVLCTDIAKDGMLSGPNFALYQSLLQSFPQLELQASGGVSSLSDLLRLKEIGAHSVIIGRALYDGRIQLKEALELC